MRFAESKEVVANETVKPIDELYQEYLKEQEKQQTLRSIVGHCLDMAEKKEHNL